MARTKASVGSKVAAGKSSKARCSAAPPPSSYVAVSSGDRSSRNHSGGNSVCPRETPKWQKPITKFFICKDTSHSSTENEIENEVAAGSSKQKQKRNVIESDDEETEKANIPVSDEENSPEKAKNTVLDDTIELEPLIGDDSHKIEEYYTKGSKGKGVGKKTRGKENIDGNERKSIKRDRNDIDTGVSEIDSVSKKIKVN